MLGGLVVALTLASAAAYTAHFQFGVSLDRVLWRFVLDYEGNIPSWYSSLVLLCCSVLLLVAAHELRDELSLHWNGLAVVFALLALDEAFVLHETSIEPLRDALGAGGLLHYTWIVPALGVLLVLGLLYLPFLRALPARTRRLFVAAGTVYVLGGIGGEAVSGVWADDHGEGDGVYAAIITVEEFLEMSGVVLFAYALLDHLTRQRAALRLDFSR